MQPRYRTSLILSLLGGLIALSCAFFSPRGDDVSSQVTSSSTQQPVAPTRETDNSFQDWQEEFHLADRNLSDTGEGKYFILRPGFQTVLQGQNARLTITVLDETREINGISTRVVEEREEKNGSLYEISRNFYAMDVDTSDAFYFGEEVDFYENGEIVGHKGEWLAFEGENRPGMIMPGTPVVGMKYYQELAPGAAMDRAEVIKISEMFETPAGTFEKCLVTEESSKIEIAKERKTYCPGVGLVQDQSLLLVDSGSRE